MSEERLATESSGTKRRTVLLGAGAVGATAVLAACGTDEADNNGTGNTDATGGTGSTPSAGQPTGGDAGAGAKLAAASDIPVGGGTIFASKGVVVTQPTAGTFKGFSSVCTHQGCPLTSVDAGVINCNCHRSQFSIEDGSVKAGPAKKPLEEKTVTKDGDDILLG